MTDLYDRVEPGDDEEWDDEDEAAEVDQDPIPGLGNAPADGEQPIETCTIEGSGSA